MGESADKDSFSEVSDSGDEVLGSDSICIADLGETGLYSGIESGDKPLSFSSSDSTSSGDSGL